MIKFYAQIMKQEVQRAFSIILFLTEATRFIMVDS